jgi:ATP-dependent DNA helicase RecG
LSLNSPLQQLRGVGERTAESLARLGLCHVRDLLFHLPIRYQDRSRIVALGALTAGDEVLVEGEVLLSELRYARRRMLLVKVGDGTGMLLLRFFHFNERQREGLARGQWLRLFGEVRATIGGGLEMVHPEYQRIQRRGELALEQGLTPVYPMGEGVRQALLRNLLDQVLVLANPGHEASAAIEWLDDRERTELGLMALDEALRTVHHPASDAALMLLLERRHPAQRRLAFEELLVQQLSFRQLRERIRSQQAPLCGGDGRLRETFQEGLVFTLTAAQQRVINEIAADLSCHSPMQRLVQGDVGSGKTVVAAMAVLQVIESGYQAAVMAPTELLAEQHYRAFCDWLQPLGVEVAWLSGTLKGRGREQMLGKISSGQARVAVGTHALFQEHVVFDHLGLVVIDEQHRFGVHQRLALREKGRRFGLCPHQLIMTATPIPRTMIMTAYADLDTSIIDELPPGRQPVQTVSVSDSRRDEVVQRVQHACLQGQQVYWVCTLIDESEVLQCQAATETAALLTGVLPDIRVGLIHGRLKSSEKEELMARFKAGDIDLLVATTVIEVGVDVPNASLMVIENADRLGLAQLHQLRGRVGRGHQRSSCVLMYHPPLGQRGRERLAILRESNDGFEIARRDLELRGPGEVLGTRQTGELQFRVADLLRDQDMIPVVNRLAAHLFVSAPHRVKPIIERWLGRAASYGEV